MSDLPPPVTVRSSKQELWDDLQCSNKEVEDVMHINSSLRDENGRLRSKLSLLEYQHRIIQTVLAATIEAA